MKKFYLIGFGILLFFDTIGQVSFKFTAIQAEPLEMSWEWIVRIFTHPWVYFAIAGYIGAFFTWMTLLKHAPIGPAFAAAHMEVLTVLIVSVWLLNEQITLGRLLGALFIISGIICLAFAEKQVLQKEQLSSTKEL